MRTMRNWAMVSGALLLAACGGDTGPQTVGSVAPPAGGGATPTPTDAFSQFVSPVEAKTYKGIGGTQVFEYKTDDRNCCNQQGQIYAGNASTVRNSAISITYDPRDAIFTLTVDDPMSGAAAGTRFQDPAARIDFDDAPIGTTKEPQWGVPDLASAATGAFANGNIQYLQAGDGDPRSPYSHGGTGFVDEGDNETPPSGEPPSSYNATTLFFEKPGTRTRYVGFAGYVRNALTFSTVTVGGGSAEQTGWHLERGAFAYGAQTANSAVPTTGSGSFTGAMLATMVYNPTFDDVGGQLPTYFQWLTGNSTVTVNFGTGTVGLAMNGIVLDAQIDRYTAPQTTVLPAGTTFSGSGSARIDLVNTGGFRGSFEGGNFTFRAPGSTTDVNVAVAGSSIDGAFFGPNAEEVGGGFRVVGGIPDQRVDILGAFTGKR